jgi:hypothetical protein
VVVTLPTLTPGIIGSSLRLRLAFVSVATATGWCSNLRSITSVGRVIPLAVVIVAGISVVPMASSASGAAFSSTVNWKASVCLPSSPVL